MSKRFRVLVSLAGLAVAAGGCSRLQAKAAFLDGNKLYQAESYRKAIVKYQEALQFEPNMAEAHFYLGSSHQALYRPNSKSTENREHLDTAVTSYRASLDLNTGDSDGLKMVRDSAISALTAIYSDDPYKDFDTAMGYASQLIAANPDDTRNMYAIANLHEKFGHVEEAQAQYEKIVEVNPSDSQACGALAAFYNKALWEGASKFDDAIRVLKQCADLTPTDATGYQKVATFYWDKSYRDPTLTPKEKDVFADQGLEAVNRALEIDSEYFEAYIFKGLLYRVKSTVARGRLKEQYLEEAKALQDEGLEIKTRQEEAAAAAQAAAAAAADAADAH